MNFRKTPLVAASCLFLFAQAATADTIVMKNGEKIVGKLLREDADSYVIEVMVTETIRDEKILPRADVSFVEKEKADLKAFAELEGLVPAPELLGKDAYELRIEKLREFLKAYPESEKAKDAKAMIDLLSAEHAIVAAGGIKFGEEMVSPEDYEANAYEYDVRISEKQIKDAVARRDLLAALRLYAEYGVKFGESEGQQGLAALMLQVLGAYKISLEENLASLDQRIEKRQAGLASMALDDRSKTESALKEQMEKIAKRFADEKAAGQKWPTPDAFHKESMDESLRLVTSETARIQNLTQGEPLKLPLAETYRVAWGKLANGTDEDKKKVLDEATANRLTPFYLEKLRIRAGLAEK